MATTDGQASRPSWGWSRNFASRELPMVFFVSDQKHGFFLAHKAHLNSSKFETSPRISKNPVAELCKTRPTSTIHPWQLALVFSSSSRYPRAKPMPPTKSTPRVDGLPTGVKVSGSKMWHWYLRSHRWTGGKTLGMGNRSRFPAIFCPATMQTSTKIHYSLFVFLMAR